MFSRHALSAEAQASKNFTKPLAPVTSELRRSAIQSQAASLRKSAEQSAREGSDS